MLDEMVLARIYLEAVLPCLEVLTRKDTTAATISGNWNGSIRLSVGIFGPRCTVELKDSAVTLSPYILPRPDIALFFPHASMLNNLFRNKGFWVALPWKGFTRLKGIMTFSRLTKRMEDIMEVRAGTDDLRAELTLSLMARAMVVIVRHDKAFAEHAGKLKGIAEFRIRDSLSTHIDFSGEIPRVRLSPAASADFSIEFARSSLFLDVSRDKVDVMASTCLGDIILRGDLHMGQTINLALDKIGQYLL